jgi:hypothetical protein
VAELMAQSDIVLDRIPLTLYRARSKQPGTDLAPAVIEGGYGAADAISHIQPHDVPRLFTDWSGGMGYPRGYGDPSQTGTYHYGLNVCTRYPNVVTPGGLVTSVDLPGSVAVAPSDAFELSGHLYILCGRYALRLQNGTGVPTIVQDFGASFTAVSCTLFRGKAYVGGLAAGVPALIWEFDGTSWTQAADVLGRFVAEVTWSAAGVIADRLIVTDSLSSFKHTAVANPNPLSDADYSSAYTVGSSAAPIQSIARAPEHVYFPCKDGIRDVFADADGNVRVVNRTPYWAKQLDDSNGQFSIVDRNHVVATFAGGLDRVDVTNLQRQDGPQWCDVGAYLPNESNIYGPGPLTLDRGWLVSLKNNGADAHVMYGVERSESGRPGIGPMIWNGSEATLLNQQATMTHVAAPNGEPRMWIGGETSDQGLPRLQWLSLPKAASPLQDYFDNGPMRFAPVGQLFQSDETWGASNALKILRPFTLQTRNLGGGALIDLYANAEHGEYAGQGSARRSPRTKITPRGPAITGYTIGIQTVLKSNPTVPAILEEIGATAEVNVDLVDEIRYPIIVARAVRTGRSNTLEYRVPRNVWRLVTRLQQSGPVQMTDEMDDVLTVNVQPGIGYRKIEDDDGKGWTRVAYLVMTVLSAATGRVMRWGVGDKWASGLVYGSQGVVGERFHWGLGSRYSRGYLFGSDP